METDGIDDLVEPLTMSEQAAPSSSRASGNQKSIKEESIVFLESLLNKNLVIHIKDGRFFRGQFMCTDHDCNIILAHTDEYSQPTPRQVEEQKQLALQAGKDDKFAVNMISRYLGLVVVPGPHIVKIELEQFISQIGV